jgi:hypothetical protein
MHTAYLIDVNGSVVLHVFLVTFIHDAQLLQDYICKSMRLLYSLLPYLNSSLLRFS